MDAISRNTASVAQDFPKAGGVHELKIPANHQLLFNNKLPSSQWTTKEAATLVPSLSNNTTYANNYQHLLQQQQQQELRTNYNQQQMNNINGQMRHRQYSTGEDDECTPSSASSTSSSDYITSPLKIDGKRRSAGSTTAVHQRSKSSRKNNSSGMGNSEQRQAISAFWSGNFDSPETSESVIGIMAAAAANHKRKNQPLWGNDENREQLIRSPPANNNNHNKPINYQKNNNPQTKRREYRREMIDNLRNNIANKENNKQNAATLLAALEYQNLNKVNSAIENYVKDMINKYYTETSMPMAAEMTHARQPTPEPQPPQQPLPKRCNRLRSETEGCIEFLLNKDDITLTITPKASAGNASPSSPMRSPLIIPPPAVTLAPIIPARPPTMQQQQQPIHQPQPMQQPQPMRQQQPMHQQQPMQQPQPQPAFSQIATLLPLLADAACQQQYLTAPLDFSKNSTYDMPPLIPNIHPPISVPKSKTFEFFPTPEATVMPKATQVSVIQPVPTPLPIQQQQQLKTAGGGQNTHDKRSSRKQATPKKIRAPPEVIVAMLRDKYLNRMVDKKLSCRTCAQDKRRAATMLVFNYHTNGSLALHKYWKHCAKQQSCRYCKQAFGQRTSLMLHYWRRHDDVMQSKRRSGVKGMAKNLKKTPKRGMKKQPKQMKKAKKAGLRA